MSKKKNYLKGVDINKYSEELCKRLTKKQMAIEILSYRLTFNVMKESGMIEWQMWIAEQNKNKKC